MKNINNYDSSYIRKLIETKKKLNVFVITGLLIIFISMIVLDMTILIDNFGGLYKFLSLENNLIIKEVIKCIIKAIVIPVGAGCSIILPTILTDKL